MERNELARTTSPKHLARAHSLAVAAAVGDITLQHRQGNGLRVHAIYSVAVSVTALAMLIALIAIASAEM